MMRTEEGEGNGRFLVLFAAMLWGTTGTAQALAPPTASPAAIGAVRLALGVWRCCSWLVAEDFCGVVGYGRCGLS
ncbi:MAG: hypothetical protein R3E31_23765 [Chloroflexota bacterium]